MNVSHGMYRWLAYLENHSGSLLIYIFQESENCAHALIPFSPTYAHYYAKLTLKMIICRKWCSYISLEMDWYHQKREVALSYTSESIKDILTFRAHYITPIYKEVVIFPLSQHKDMLLSSYREVISCCCLHLYAHWFWGVFCCIIACSWFYFDWTRSS